MIRRRTPAPAPDPEHVERLEAVAEAARAFRRESENYVAPDYGYRAQLRQRLYETLDALDGTPGRAERVEAARLADPRSRR